MRLFLDQAVHVQTLAGDTVLCSWARHFPLRTKVPCSYQGKHSCFSTVASQCPSSPRSVQMGAEEFNAGGSSAIFKHSLRAEEEILHHGPGVHVFLYSPRPWSTNKSRPPPVASFP